MKALRIKPGTMVRLSRFDPDGDGVWADDKDAAVLRLQKLREEISELQRVFYAERKHRLLVILQAMDTGGKDGTVRNVFSGIDPHGLKVISFKSPTMHELDYDYLRRIHHAVPGRGEVVVFNRSHYEDIVAVKVKKLAPRSVWEKRFDHVTAFEKLLTDEGTTILKFYLHISRAEQRRRLLERLHNPKKHWKFDPEDINDRQRWPKFIAAYEEVLTRTSTPWAPWHIVPANKKYFRNVAVAEAVRDTLRKLRPAWPAPKHDPRQFAL
jgi:PPK2 family polyphosphate:nucleotide phosphotransferase